MVNGAGSNRVRCRRDGLHHVNNSYLNPVISSRTAPSPMYCQHDISVVSRLKYSLQVVRTQSDCNSTVRTSNRHNAPEIRKIRIMARYVSISILIGIWIWVGRFRRVILWVHWGRVLRLSLKNARGLINLQVEFVLGKSPCLTLLELENPQ